MAEESPSYLQEACTTARGDRMVTASLVCEQGVSNMDAGLLVTDGPTGLGVLVAAGTAFVEGTEITNQGMYHVFNDASKTITASAADPTDDRIDLVIARVYDSEYSGALDEWRIEFVTGTPSPSPAPPALPANSLALAEVLVQSGATTLAPGDITDVRVPAALCAGNGFLGTVVYDTAGSFTFEKEDYPGMRSIKVRIQGGAGAGGGAPATGVGESSCGSGGTSGAYAEKHIDREDLAASVTVTVGAAGSTTSGGPGNNGGSSTFDTYTVPGGTGGGVLAAGAGTAYNAAPIPPANPGVGDWSTGGHHAGNGQRMSANDILSGAGGDSLLGTGGRSVAATAVGIAGDQGGGGGGAANQASSGAKAGGPGGAGIIIVEMYG